MAFRLGTELVRVNNEPRAITRLVRMLERRQPELVVLEASGGYEMAVLERLLAKEIPVALLKSAAGAPIRPSERSDGEDGCD